MRFALTLLVLIVHALLSYAQQYPGVGVSESREPYQQVIGQAPAQYGSINPEIRQRCLAASVRVNSFNGQGYSLGSGTVIHSTPEGSVIITCAHVIEGRQNSITLQSGQTLPAQQIERVPNQDLASVFVRQQMQAVRVAQADNPDAKPLVLQIGFPNGRGPRAQLGHELGESGIIPSQGNRKTFGASFPTIDGDSGGGVFNAQTGELVAVVWGGAPHAVQYHAAFANRPRTGSELVGLADLHSFIARDQCFWPGGGRPGQLPSYGGGPGVGFGGGYGGYSGGPSINFGGGYGGYGGPSVNFGGGYGGYGGGLNFGGGYGGYGGGVGVGFGGGVGGPVPTPPIYSPPLYPSTGPVFPSFDIAVPTPPIYNPPVYPTPGPIPPGISAGPYYSTYPSFAGQLPVLSLYPAQLPARPVQLPEIDINIRERIRDGFGGYVGTYPLPAQYGYGRYGY
jgi:hypothetical protein